MQNNIYDSNNIILYGLFILLHAYRCRSGLPTQVLDSSNIMDAYCRADIDNVATCEGVLFNTRRTILVYYYLDLIFIVLSLLL